jgi:hypothetical protein
LLVVVLVALTHLGKVLGPVAAVLVDLFKLILNRHLLQHIQLLWVLVVLTKHQVQTLLHLVRLQLVVVMAVRIMS